MPQKKTIALMPYPPVGGKIGVECLFVRFPDEVCITPGETTTLYLSVPVDIGLYVGNSLIRAVSLRPKYALYGPPDLGDLCRYSSQELVKDLDPCLKTTLRLRVVNSSKTVTRVSKAVLPAKGLGMYLSLSGQPLITSAKLVVYSQTYAEVATELLPSLEVGEVSKLVVEPTIATYIMRYGL